MSSPPSSPAAITPNVSPPSSPVPIESSPPPKRRSWQVYSTCTSGTSGASGRREHSKSTSWRWRTIGLNTKEDLNVLEHPVTDKPPATGDTTSADEELHNLNKEQIQEENESLVFPECDPLGQSSECLSFVSNLSVVSYSGSDLSESSASGSSVHSNETDFDAESSTDSIGSEDGLNNTDGENSVGSDSNVQSEEYDDDFENDYIELYEGCEHSVDEAVLDLLTDHIKNQETRKSLEDHLRTFLKYIPKHNNMPKSCIQLLNFVERCVPAYKELSYSYCAKCYFFLENFGPCNVCGSDERHQFYVCSMHEQIKSYFEQGNLADVLDKYRDSRQSTDGKIQDILDGSEYQRVKVDDKYSLTLMMNTDGVALSKSSRTTMWPVMFVICEVPFHLRQRFLIVSGIWCDSKDPPMNTFLKPFVDELERIDENGGVLWTDPTTQVVHQSRIFTPLICADAPARAKLQNILSHNGKQGCNTCEQRTVTLPFTEEEKQAKAAGKNVRRKRGYIFREDPAKLRTDKRMRQQARRAHLNNKTVKGVKGPTTLTSIPKIDIAKCVYAEYMHGVCLGVVRQFLTLWLTVPGAWNVSGYKSEIDAFLRNIAPSSDICRLPRSISELKQWKASELRAWLLFYSLPCLFDKLPHEYVQHWSLLVMSLFLLLHEEISEHDVNVSETMLKLFVRGVALLYRQSDCVYNVHQLLHLPLYVKRLGPLWSTSAFFFENYNGNLVSLIHGTKNPGKELMKNVRIAHAVEILRSKVHGRSSNRVTGVSAIEPLNFCHDVNLSVEYQDLRAANGMNVSVSGVIFSRLRKGKEIYTSQLYGREKKRNNFTVKFNSAGRTGYGMIKYFAVEGDGILVVVNKLRVNHTKFFVHEASGATVKHIIPVEEDPQVTVLLNFNDILMKVIKVCDTVCYLPNHLEKNL